MDKPFIIVPKELRFFETSKFTYSRGKFFHLHIPIALSRILNMKEGDQANIFVNIDEGVIVLKLIQKK